MIPTIFCHGTYALEASWWRPGSPFATEAARHNVHLPAGHRPFRWTGELGGLPLAYPPDPQSRWANRKLTAWEIAGEALYHYGLLVGGGEPVNLLTHSHGLQVGAFACAFGLRVNAFLSIAGPVRRDMQRVRRAALGNIERCVQVVDPAGDETIVKGEVLDGHLGPVYALPEPGAAYVEIPGIGHSGLFERQYFPLWEVRGLWGYLIEPMLI